MSDARGKQSSYVYGAQLAVILLLSSTVFSVPAHAGEWPQFRGPDGQGHAAGAAFPSTWSEQENVRWKTPTPGRGWSSPVVHDGHIWLTTADEALHTLEVLQLDLKSGKLLKRIELFKSEDLGRVAPKNSHASPTPVIDGERVYVHFGAHGTACLDAAGNVLWKTQLLYNHHHGPANSPVIWQDTLIVVCDGLDQQYVAGLDKLTGRIRWQTKRDGDHSYCTPLVVRTTAGDQIVCPGGNQVTAYDPQQGDEIWTMRYEGHSIVPRPVAADGLVYVCSGYWTPTLYAIRLDGTGDVTNSHVAWTMRRGVPHNPSPLLVDRDLYLVSDRGILTRLNADDGSELERLRLPGDFSASPTLAGGWLYVSNEAGVTYVLALGDKLSVVAQNTVDGQTLASPAFVDGQILLRSDTALYCIDEPSAAAQPVAQQPRKLPLRTKR